MAGPYYRTPLGYLWDKIQTLRTGDTITLENTWKEGMHRLQDYAAGVYDSLLSFRSELAGQYAAAPAVLRGSVALGAITYYDPIDTPVGSLDGKTLLLEWDGAGSATTTFAQPQGPADVIAQINTATAGAVTASVDDGVDPITGAVTPSNVGKLRLVRNGSGASLTVKGTGTANATLGFALVDTTASGSGSVNDGTTRVGFAGYSSGSINIAAGTLRNALEEIIVNLAAPDKVTDYSAADTNQTITEIDGLVLAVDAATALRTYTLQAPTTPGKRVTIVRNAGGTNAVQVTGFTNGTLVTFAAGVTKAAEFRSIGALWYLVNEWPE